MISRHEVRHDTKDGIWSRLAAPVSDEARSWRQDGKVVARDGRYFARFVVYIEANTVRERLDAVVPGEWDLTLDLLPHTTDADGNPVVSFKARLQILGVIREDVGQGKDYKQASTDAFKRAAVRFGVGHELYAYEQNWVQVDSDSRYAKPLEDPQAAYTRRYGGSSSPAKGQAAPDRDRAAAGQGTAQAAIPDPYTSNERVNAGGQQAEAQERVAADRDSDRAVQRVADHQASQAGAPKPGQPDDSQLCPKCSGRMWDNRLSKRNPKAPDFKCRDRSCDGVIWPERPSPQQREAPPTRPGEPAQRQQKGRTDDSFEDFPGALEDEADDLPF